MNRDNNVVFLPGAEAPVQVARPRFSFVRNTYLDYHGMHALYDIVDNSEGAEQVLASGVRYLSALLIVAALNDQDEVAQLLREQQEAPTPAA